MKRLPGQRRDSACATEDTTAVMGMQHVVPAREEAPWYRDKTNTSDPACGFGDQQTRERMRRFSGLSSAVQPWVAKGPRGRVSASSDRVWDRALTASTC